MMSRHPRLMGTQFTCLGYLMVRFSQILSFIREYSLMKSLGNTFRSYIPWHHVKRKNTSCHVGVILFEHLPYTLDEGGKLLTKYGCLAMLVVNGIYKTMDCA